MVNSSTNINKTNNHLWPKESLTVMVNSSTNINKTNNHLWPKESLNSYGQQFTPISIKQTITSDLKKV